MSSHGNAFSSPGFGGSSDEFANAEVDGKRQLDNVSAYTGTSRAFQVR